MCFGRGMILTLLLSFSTVVVVARDGAMSGDHRDASEKYCRTNVGAAGPAYHECLQNELSQLGSFGPLTDLSVFPAPEQRRVRVACSGTKALGGVRFEQCLRNQIQNGEQSGQQAPAKTSLAPIGSLPNMSNRRSGRSMEPDEIFATISSSIYMVTAHKRGSEKYNQGSAVAVADRLLITNCHVLEDATMYFVEDEVSRWEVEIRGGDQKTDRCVLFSPKTLLRPVAGIRSFESLRIGERAYTVGNPSSLERTLADGLISGLRRNGEFRYIQTTAAIAPGSSGGGLFDSQGRLIGITTFMLGRQGSLNFAIAIDEFLELPQLVGAGTKK